MLRTPRWPLVVAIAVWLCSAAAPLSAIGPALLMFYGGSLSEPIFVRPGNPSVTPTTFLWSQVNGGVPYESRERGALPANLEGRRYVNLAIFWRQVDESAAVTPGDASQHARIYLPTASAPAAIVITAPLMNNPPAVAVPTSLEEFVAGWTFTPAQVGALRGLVSLF